MGARVIHFGPDDCHRRMVLRTAGYSIEDCPSLIQLRDRLADGEAADALLMTDTADAEPWEAVALAKTRASLPVILFRTTTLTYEQSGVDLVVDCLTPPEVWLNEVDALIAKSRAVRAQSQALAREARQLRRESEMIRAKSRAERARSHEERARPATEHTSSDGPIPPKDRFR